MKHIRTLLWVFVGLAFIGFIALSLPKKDNTSPIAVPVAGFNQGKNFTLTTHKNSIFNSQTDIPEGHFALIFFGFTHCPVICPTELQKFAVIMDILDPSLSEKLTPLFITIDPERDTVEVLKDYVPLFHPSIIGLTSDVKTIHRTLDDWKVYYTKVNDPDLSDYTMDHSTFAYLVDNKMTIHAIFKMSDSAEKIATFLETKL